MVLQCRWRDRALVSLERTPRRVPLARVSGSRNRLTPLRTVFVTDSPYARRALIHHRLICAVAVAVGVGTGKSGAESRQMEAIVNNFHFSIFCFSILSFAFYLRLRHIPSYTLSFVCSFHSHPPLSSPALSFALALCQTKTNPTLQMPSLFASLRLARGSWRELSSDWSVAAMGVDLLAPRPERRAANGFVCVCVVELSFARLDQVAVSPSELSLICVQLCSAMSHDCRSLTVRKWSSAAL